jgi:hypothetical protein
MGMHPVTFGTFTMSLRPDTSSQSPSNPTKRFTSSFLGWFGDLQDQMFHSHGRMKLLTRAHVSVGSCPSLENHHVTTLVAEDASRHLVHQHTVPNGVR